MNIPLSDKDSTDKNQSTGKGGKNVWETVVANLMGAVVSVAGGYGLIQLFHKFF